MTKDVRTHSTKIEMSGDVPSEVAVGAEIVLKVKVSCEAGCDLRGTPVKIATPDDVAVTSELATCDAGINETADIALKAPHQVGEHVWSVSFAPHEADGILHEPKTLPVSVKTRPQSTSLAVWDIPSPVVTGERFGIKVGAKSAAGCKLDTKEIEVCDASCAVVAHANLGETPWPGTSALYWTDVELLAPVEAGMSSWSVKFAAAELELPHDGASSNFSVAIVKSPQHRLTVKVVEKETAIPIENAQVRLGAYRAATGPSGLAEIKMPAGTYDLNIWKVGYEAPSTTVEVNEDVTVQIEVLVVPKEDPDAAWLM
jgi:uncharacterized membrane protein